MIEIIGAISSVIAIAGVAANNRRIRWCFLLWVVSNTLSLAIHAHAGIWSLAARYALFLILAVEGWFKWGKKNLTANGH